MSHWSRSPAASLVRCAFVEGVLVPTVRTYFRPFRVVPHPSNTTVVHGPLLIVANHASHLDAPAVLAALPPHIRHHAAVAAAQDYFYRSQVLGAAASLGLGTFAFPRHGRDGSTQAAALLADGWNVLLFPQGSRGTDDTWQPFRVGVGHLVAESGASVLPVAIRGTRALWPRGQRLPRRGPLEIRLGHLWQPQPHMQPSAIAADLEHQVKELLK